MAQGHPRSGRAVQGDLSRPAGAGWTGAPRRGYTRDQLLDTLGLDSVHLLTHDYGALVGYQLCLRHPERVRRDLSLGIPPPYFGFDLRMVLALVRRAWFDLLIPVPVVGPWLLGRGRQCMTVQMLSGFSSAHEAFTAEVVELFVGRLREPSRARAGSALYRHFIQPESARIMRGSYRDRRLSTPTRVLLGAGDPIVRPEFIHGVAGTHQGEFMGIAPTGNRVEFSAIDIARNADGKIVEHWSNSDQLGLMRQLGVTEQPSG